MVIDSTKVVMFNDRKQDNVARVEFPVLSCPLGYITSFPHLPVSMDTDTHHYISQPLTPINTQFTQQITGTHTVHFFQPYRHLFFK